MRSQTTTSLVLILMSLWSACGTVDLGDNFVPPDLMLDEDFFFCRIQPEIIQAQGCATGGPGEGGMCHTARSALRLTAAPGVMLGCTDGFPNGPIPLEYQANLDAVRFTVQSDPLSSPFYRRPLLLDSHPRLIFAEGSAEADLIIEWIIAGGM